MIRVQIAVWALGENKGTDQDALLMEGIRRAAEGYKVRGLYP